MSKKGRNAEKLEEQVKLANLENFTDPARNAYLARRVQSLIDQVKSLTPSNEPRSISQEVRMSDVMDKLEDFCTRPGNPLAYIRLFAEDGTFIEYPVTAVSLQSQQKKVVFEAER